MVTEFQKALSSSNELQITVIGRKTGKKFSTPVWFVSERDKLYLLPVRGSVSNWYRNILKEPTMELIRRRVFSVGQFAHNLS
jgi:hypothetical protein